MELYDLGQHPTQVNDLAQREPQRLRDMQQMFLMAFAAWRGTASACRRSIA